ncbi:macrophage mannose receptor 1-like [Pomacea canaliculata]|uniref:macrophage mannose receptor 1-like n=1 Tax=Pomacea canaliculata TaxID=400727 RepID=UPI000D73971C|nr:macrophage mannose receptor 1-like [Pomacea canaliculata]
MAPEGIFIIFSLCLATTSVVSDICPLHDHNIIEFGDTCYLFVTSVRATYSAALSTCRIFGGELAAVENVETQKFLQEQLSGRLNYSQPVWIGLTRAQDNSTFAFPDGSIPKFWNWAREEPGNVSSGNVCVAMDAGNNGAWITYSCDSFLSTATRLGHVCEFASENKTAGAKTTPLPSTPSIPSIPSCSALSHPSSTDLVAYGNSCYLFVVARTASYYAVQDTCRVYRGQLAVIRDKDTQLFLLDQLTTKFNYSQPVWIGLVRDEPLGPFRTPEGITVEYPNFVEEDGSSNSTKGCVAIDPQSSNGLKLYPCSASFALQYKFGHVCEFAPSAVVFPTTQISAWTSPTQEISSTNQVTISTNVVEETTEHVTLTTTQSISPSSQSSPELISLSSSSTKQTSISEPLETETTVATSTPSATPSTILNTTRGSELAGSVCQQCGDLDSSTPCSDEELFMATTSKCDDATPYCINDIFQNDGQAVFYKRCVNTELCTQLWYVESSDRVQCIQYDPVVYTEDLVCHLCCYGDTCNGNIVPPAETLFIPR